MKIRDVRPVHRFAQPTLPCFLARMNDMNQRDKASAGLIQLGILVYWTLFWLFNVVDKGIGGAHFLWVGRDRFAQFQKYFASAGLNAPWIADAGLIVAAVLEVFALVFCAGALIHFLRARHDRARGWFCVGVLLTLVTFTFFSLGDHLFGDRFELLEHTMFWFIALLSWHAYTRLKVKTEWGKDTEPRAAWTTVAIAALLIVMTSASIFSYNTNCFHRRTDGLEAERVGDHLYKVSFPFLGGSTVFEETLRMFKEAHPNESIDHIYTVPNPLRLKKADALIFYISTTEAR